MTGTKSKTKTALIICRRTVCIIALTLLGGAAQLQSALGPIGDRAERIAALFWLFTAVGAIVWIAVVGMMLFAISRRRAAASRAPLELDDARERRMNTAVAVAGSATVIVLVALTVLSFLNTRGFGATPQDAVHITLTGKQWWWQAEYKGADSATTFTTANELHVPVGQPVSVTLFSNDVIHSFWVPNVAGKLDLIPGHSNTLSFTVMQPGVYRGQCAEFCGLQHAHMGLLVVAESPQQFAAWRQHELAAAEAPADEERAQGMLVFSRNGCGSCHTVRGTEASGLLGPDLTHVGARSYLAAGTLPNSRGNLQGWIADPQGVKPGANMPRLELSANDLDAVSAYLAGLK